MIHHLGIFAADFARSRAFFGAALAPLGIVIGYEAADVWSPTARWSAALPGTGPSTVRTALS